MVSAALMLVPPHRRNSTTRRLRRRIGIGAGRRVALLAVAAALMPAAAGAAPRLPAGDEIVVWVKFKDRGPLETASVEVRRAVARSQISSRSLERRARRGGGGGLLETDLPVHQDYVHELRARGFAVRAVSRWLNAASVIADPARLREIRSLPFVAGIEAVPRYRLRPDTEIGPPDEGTGIDPEPGRNVLRASPDAAAAALDAGDPLFYGGSWAQHRLIDTDDLHARGLSGEGVLIAVLDTGFRETHTAFDSLDVLARRDFIHGDEIVANEPGQDPDPGAGPNQASHGTYALSVIAGNWPGVHMGTAYHAQIALAKTEWMASETAVEMDYWQMAAEWADSLGADIISSSLGYTTFDDTTQSYTYLDLDGETTVVTLAAVEAARRGITVVTAQGNGGDDSWHYLIAPADADSAVAVGAVDSLGVIAAFSSFGPTADGRVKPDVCAMGRSVQLTSVVFDSSFVRYSGTSFSTPAIAGLAALLLEAHPSWGPYQVIEALRSTADRFATPDSQYGFGVARGELAVDWVPGAVAAAAPRTSPGLRYLGAHPRRGAPVRLQLTMGGAGGPARLDLYDVRGRHLANLFQEQLAAGDRRTVSWGGVDDAGSRVAPGLYLARFTAPGIQVTRRVVWIP